MERIFKEETNAMEFNLQSIRLVLFFFSRILFSMLIKETEESHF